MCRPFCLTKTGAYFGSGYHWQRKTTGNSDSDADLEYSPGGVTSSVEISSTREVYSMEQESHSEEGIAAENAAAPSLVCGEQLHVHACASMPRALHVPPPAVVSASASASVPFSLGALGLGELVPFSLNADQGKDASSPPPLLRLWNASNPAEPLGVLAGLGPGLGSGSEILSAPHFPVGLLGGSGSCEGTFGAPFLRALLNTGRPYEPSCRDMVRRGDPGTLFQETVLRLGETSFSALDAALPQTDLVREIFSALGDETDMLSDLGGNRHLELQETRENPPKRDRGTPETQETPPSPSPKRIRDSEAVNMEMLQTGEPPVHEPGLEGLVQEHEELGHRELGEVGAVTSTGYVPEMDGAETSSLRVAPQE